MTARVRAAVDARDFARALPIYEALLRDGFDRLRAAALRFWLSRLGDWHLPREADLLAPKDPQHFERVLRERIATPWHPPR